MYPWRVITRKRRQKSGKQNNTKTKANDQNTGHQPKRCSSGNAKVKKDKQESYAYQRKDNWKKATESKDANNREGEYQSNSGNWTDKQKSRTCVGDSLENLAKECKATEKQSSIKTKVNADTSIKHTSDYSENAKAGIEQSESKETAENKEEKQSSTYSKVNSDDTSFKHTSSNSENTKAGTEQGKSKQTESQENVPGKQLNLEEKKNKSKMKEIVKIIFPQMLQ